MKLKRVIYWLRWRAIYGGWVLTCGQSLYVPLVDGNLNALKDQKKAARLFCRARWEQHGELCQLRICNKGDQRVMTEHTYGKDPRRYPG